MLLIILSGASIRLLPLGFTNERPEIRMCVGNVLLYLKFVLFNSPSSPNSFQATTLQKCFKMFKTFSRQFIWNGSSFTIIDRYSLARPLFSNVTVISVLYQFYLNIYFDF